MRHSGRDAFITDTHYVICDCLSHELQRRNEAYKHVEGKFGFITKTKSMEIGEISAAMDNLRKIYPNNLEEDFTAVFPVRLYGEKWKISNLHVSDTERAGPEGCFFKRGYLPSHISDFTNRKLFRREVVFLVETCENLTEIDHEGKKTERLCPAGNWEWVYNLPRLWWHNTWLHLIKSEKNASVKLSLLFSWREKLLP